VLFRDKALGGFGIDLGFLGFFGFNQRRLGHRDLLR
jgi:hypothetical protein